LAFIVTVIFDLTR